MRLIRHLGSGSPSPWSVLPMLMEPPLSFCQATEVAAEIKKKEKKKKKREKKRLEALAVAAAAEEAENSVLETTMEVEVKNQESALGSRLAAEALTDGEEGGWHFHHDFCLHHTSCPEGEEGARVVSEGHVHRLPGELGTMQVPDSSFLLLRTSGKGGGWGQRQLALGIAERVQRGH